MGGAAAGTTAAPGPDRKSTRLNSSHSQISYAFFCLKKNDALVQFGESTFLGRTAYAATHLTSHEVTVVGLQSDRTYYYQVVSRDLAGNTTVDDNHC